MPKISVIEKYTRIRNAKVLSKIHHKKKLKKMLIKSGRDIENYKGEKQI